MGNINDKEDSGGSSGDVDIKDEGVVDEDDDCHDHDFSSNMAYTELMGQSPPDSPRAVHSPLMFTPQIPVVPLQRSNETRLPAHSWMQVASGYDDRCYEQGIPTVIMWNYEGKEVSVAGSWDNWKTRKTLQRSGKDFALLKVLPSGVYQYRFIVDGEWKHSPDIPWAQDDAGNAYNVLDLQGFVPEDLASISGFEAPQSPESSYNNTQFGAEEFAKEPPLVPPHLQMTLLNGAISQVDLPLPLSKPPHVVLNHLYMHKGKSTPSVVALGSTHRFMTKYVSVILYKSLQR